MDRARYELVRQNQAAIRNVNLLVNRESHTVLAGVKNLGRQATGGFLRQAVPGLIDRYGKVNSALAVDYYKKQKFEAYKIWAANGGQRQGQKSAASTRKATAMLRGQLYAPRAIAIDAAALADPIIGYGMSLLERAGVEAMTNELSNAMTRAVASYNRDTMLYNSALDSSVAGVIRVAEPGACDFCQTVSVSSQGARQFNYAADWHNHCHCSIETVFAADAPYQSNYFNTPAAEDLLAA